MWGERRRQEAGQGPGGQLTLALTAHSEHSSLGKGAAQSRQTEHPEMKSRPSAFQDSGIPTHGWVPRGNHLGAVQREENG